MDIKKTKKSNRNNNKTGEKVCIFPAIEKREL